MRRRQLNQLTRLESSKPRLLYDREQAAELLGGVSTQTLIRLEQAGVLTPIKLAASPNGKTYYGHDNLVEAAQGR
jgi:hypothetical protein